MFGVDPGVPLSLNGTLRSSHYGHIILQTLSTEEEELAISLNIEIDGRVIEPDQLKWDGFVSCILVIGLRGFNPGNIMMTQNGLAQSTDRMKPPSRDYSSRPVSRSKGCPEPQKKISEKIGTSDIVATQENFDQVIKEFKKKDDVV